MTTLFAQSYLYRDTGFYFDSIEEFDAGMKRLNAKGIEEVEIQFIDGEDYEAKLFNAAGISQSNVYEWFEHLNDFNEYSATQITYLLELGYSLQEALDKHEDVYLLGQLHRLRSIRQRYGAEWRNHRNRPRHLRDQRPRILRADQLYLSY